MLRELDAEDLDDALGRLTDSEQRRRVRHVVTENTRVLETIGRLRRGDVASIGPLLTASHDSLRDDYEVSAPELDAAVEAALGVGALGARMTGGGFGGCAIALTAVDLVGAVVEAAEKAFAARGFTSPRCFSVAPAAGARRVA
jgi:galactokinase